MGSVSKTSDVGTLGYLHHDQSQTHGAPVSKKAISTTASFHSFHGRTFFLVDGDPIGGLEPAVVLHVIDAVLKLPKLFVTGIRTRRAISENSERSLCT